MSKSIRSGSGVGDNIYLHSIVRHLAKMNPGIYYSVKTRYPDLFKQLPGNVGTEQFSKVKCDIVAHYSSRKQIQNTSQYQDMLITAGLDAGLSMETDWQVMNHALADEMTAKANGKKIILANSIRAPMGRDDGFGLEIMPGKEKYDEALFALKKEVNGYVFQIGGKDAIGSHQSEYYDDSLVGRTSISDIMDIASVCDYTFGQCSQVIPMGEIFGKPVMIVWGHRVKQSREAYVRTILPEKILHGEKSSWVYDNWSNEDIKRRISEWVNQTS